MSLQVWLPFNGNLNNYGFSEARCVITNVSMPTINTNGKIGSCYSFDGTDDYIHLFIPDFDVGNTELSIAFWCKPANSDLTGIFTARKNSIHQISLYSTGLYFRDSNHSSLTSFQFEQPTSGVWSHYAIIYDNGSWIIYKNGLEIKRQIYSSASLNTDIDEIRIGIYQSSSENIYYRGLLNDFRIYDHALSAKEVKEISKGLVLQYGFDDIVNKNIISSRKSYSPTSYQAYQFNLSENFVASQTYTFQLWDVNVAHSGKTEAQLGISIYWGGGSVNLKRMNGTSWFTNGHADYIKFSITITSSQAAGSGAANSWINIYNSVPSATGDKSMSIGRIKIEKGNVATPYTNFNEAQAIMHDESGYKYDGIITGELITNTNSARYNNCIFISNGLTNYIKTPTINIAGDAITVSIWIKSTNTNPTGSYHMPFESSTPGYVEMSIYKTGYLRAGLYVGGSRKVDNTSGVNVLDGNWHMISMTYDGENIKRYVDGIVLSTTAVTGTLNATSQEYYFGKYGTNNTYAANEMHLSDARLYATALSEEDIKELYDTSAFIDNFGNVSCYEFEEQNENLLKYEYTLLNTNTASSCANTRGKYTYRNGEVAMAFQAKDTYFASGDDRNSLLLYGFFKENTRYVFDLWMDVDDIISGNVNMVGGFSVRYTDGTSSTALNATGTTGSQVGWIHKVFISATGKSVKSLVIPYYTSIPFYVRADSFITPLYETKINKNGVIDTSQFIENTDVAFIGTGDVNSNKFLEI